ncbi:Uncharacterized protein Adt_29576 [Abeliophyllum distichum]|uniref:Retrotransposon Copia-like N-terminal domain-containing protein n=1 Tax=Abeliophyllum distichum TaxID=126358 RepID=A0ABD1R8R0_9LAMI
MVNVSACNDSPLVESSTMVPIAMATNHISPFDINLTQIPSVKLDKNNFLLWKNMIMPIIKGHNLEGFILGTKKCPPEFIGAQAVTNEGESVETSPNLEYSKWTSTNQLLMGWLYSSMTPEIAMKESMSIDQYLTTVKQLADNLEITVKLLLMKTW